ncbi:hypothetical protein TcWFU_007514 [Taenia crassiceps]|uniref:Uncharacterized protein n=1 Tax=Taenia crassiceps TaxID=6207 RepID=A0ABR4QCE3_9CEST
MRGGGWDGLKWGGVGYASPVRSRGVACSGRLYGPRTSSCGWEAGVRGPWCRAHGTLKPTGREAMPYSQVTSSPFMVPRATTVEKRLQAAQLEFRSKWDSPQCIADAERGNLCESYALLYRSSSSVNRHAVDAVCEEK